MDAVMYAETVAITEAFTDVTKIGVRRPPDRLRELPERHDQPELH